MFLERTLKGSTSQVNESQKLNLMIVLLNRAILVKPFSPLVNLQIVDL